MPTSRFAPKTALERLMLPLDVPTVAEAETLVKQTEGTVGVYKIGMELQFAGGLEFARDLAESGHKNLSGRETPRYRQHNHQSGA